MKSRIEDLRKRGKFHQEDIEQIKNLKEEELMELINSPVAATRSAAVHILSQRGFINQEEFVGKLLLQLTNEKCLYTKIEICEALEQGDSKTAANMVEYLSRIGKNQHVFLPDKVSRKISFPCPRDIIARSLGRMNPSILPVLVEVLYSGDTDRISEVLDAIGRMVFYNQDLVNHELLQHITKTMDTYVTNIIIYWKCILCLSAFPLQETKEILKLIIATNELEIIQCEAKRSLNLISTT